MKGFHAGVHTLIDEPTYVPNVHKLVAGYVKKNRFRELWGIKVDVEKFCSDDYYFVKKSRQIIEKADRYPTGLIPILEQVMMTDFKHTRDYKEKVKKYLANNKGNGRKRIIPVERRLVKARKKLGWTQDRLAEELGYNSRKTIQRYEDGSQYPPKRVFKWLDSIEK